MKRVKHFLILMIMVVGAGLTALANPTDSIGTKVKNGKIFILHKVEKAQGLFAISRRYGVALNDIIQANPGSDQMLQIDQILLIPTGKDAPMEDQKVKEYFSEDKGSGTNGSSGRNKKSTFARYHTVAQGETLYSISVLYDTKVDVIKDLNGLETDVLSVGQQIMVPASKEEKEEQDEKVAEAKQKVDDAASKTEKLRENISPAKKDEPQPEIKEHSGAKYEVKVEKMPKYNVEKISEKGYSEALEDEVNSQVNKRVCSHHTASIGSTVMVTNPTNQKSVFVKVVANHTLDEEKGNIIRLSQTALSDIEIEAGSQVQVSFAR